MKNIDRRTFLEFLGIGTAAVLTPGCFPTKSSTTGMPAPSISLAAIPPSSIDRVKLAKGLKFDVLVSWGDAISKSEEFGFNNDYVAFLPSENGDPNEGILWVNHEYTDPHFVSNFWDVDDSKKTREQVELEMLSVGGSFIRLRKVKNKWRMVKNDPFNRRVTGLTEIPFNWHEPIHGSKTAIGTIGNCAGGVTPWGTILTCEENYHMFYGERNYRTGERKTDDAFFGWYHHFDYPPEHYGWVVEVDPKTGKAQKHVALGRCAHESATVYELPDGRVVVYSGDDAIYECLYKFISSKPGSLSEGTLYVANTEKGRWIPIDYDAQPILQRNFDNQTHVLIRMRDASKLLGGTPLDRPEDIEIVPTGKGEILVSLTNNAKAGNLVGSIMKIAEKDGKHDALEFEASTFLAGGEETGFACPDNLAFDPNGNLWFTSDISGSAMNNPKAPTYQPFKNNSLFVVPRDGEQKGQVLRVGNAPTDAEFTGPYFTPDGKTLFLAVQHPGEYSLRPDALTSHWPGGGTEIPKPSVLAITLPD